MSRLSDQINEAILSDLHLHGALEPHRIKYAIKVKLEDDERDMLVDEALVSRISAAGKRSKASAVQSSKQPAQLRLFPELRSAYSIDPGDRRIMLTEDLNRLDFRRIIKMRRDQIKNDAAHLKLLETALAAVEPIWDENPALSFGEVCKLYEAQLQAPQPVTA